MNIQSFEEMYVAELQEARSLEEMLAAVLPALAERASEPDLRQALLDHGEETAAHLDAVSALLDAHGAGAEHFDSSIGAMVQEAEKMTQMIGAGPLRDAAIIASLQRFEHYETAVYGTLATYAKGLGLTRDKSILGTILDEEKAADKTLSAIAVRIVNPQALATAA